MPVKAVVFDAYGTLIRNEALHRIPQRIVADHGLSARAEDVFDAWIDRYSEAIQRPPFRTLREIQHEIFEQVLRGLGIDADATPYVELFFETTTRVELYPEVPEVLRTLSGVRTAIVSNADHEHLAAWRFTLPVEFIVISEGIRAYKPDPLVFRTVLERLGLEAHEVLHVGDSDVDDVKGAKAAGLRVAWLNREGRRRRPDVPRPDFEIRDLKELPSLL
ncbi:MAG TPA: HAD family hydrolase [Methylomirabilota bacterium]|jgi:2-haloalkanoic acid dehalogenase type II